jgi:hypothetical protein
MGIFMAALLPLRLTPLIPLDPKKEVIPCNTEECANLASRVCSICGEALCNAEDCRRKWGRHSPLRCSLLDTETLIQRYRVLAQARAAQYNREYREIEKGGRVPEPREIERLEDPEERIKYREITIRLFLKKIELDFALYNTYSAVRKVLQERKDVPGRELTGLASVQQKIKNDFARYCQIIGCLLKAQEEDRPSPGASTSATARSLFVDELSKILLPKQGINANVTCYCRILEDLLRDC